jgi:hypothetical protein
MGQRRSLTAAAIYKFNQLKSIQKLHLQVQFDVEAAKQKGAIHIGPPTSTSDIKDRNRLVNTWLMHISSCLHTQSLALVKCIFLALYVAIFVFS